MADIDFKLIFMLSLFGMVMGVGTVFVIPSKIEPLCWLAIFALCAFVIAKRARGKPFLHGFLLSLANCVWITGAHVLLADAYVARHPEEAAMLAKMPLPTHPRVMMLLTGPVVGVVSGLVMGLFAFVASKLVKRSAETMERASSKA